MLNLVRLLFCSKLYQSDIDQTDKYKNFFGFKLNWV